MEKNNNVLEKINAKLAHCSKGHRKIGEYLLGNYAAASYMTAAKEGASNFSMMPLRLPGSDTGI